MITIVNYKMGNIRSIVNALDFLGIASRVESSPAKVASSDMLILPGVGSYFVAMENLRDMGLHEALQEAVVVRERPILGICLGMQLLAESGTEDGFMQGLGWIEGHVQRFEFEDPTYRIPHTGFNFVQFASEENRLFRSMGTGADFYFVHSYHLSCNEQYVAGRTDYYGSFISAVERGNVFGVQFHPEKSQSNGLAVLSNFSRIS